MEQFLRVTPVVGLPQFNGWSHVWELVLDPQTTCVFCLSVSGDNASNIGRDITASIEQLPPRSAQGLYQTLADCIQLTHDQHGQLSISGGIFRNKRSIFATYQSAIILKRGAKVGRIIQSDTELQLIEGRFDIDDVFVFSTDAARQFMPQIELSFQRGFDSDGVITAIVPALHSLDDSSSSALAFVAVVEEDKLLEPEAPPAMEIDFQTTSDEAQPVVAIQQEPEEQLTTPALQADEEPLTPLTDQSHGNLEKLLLGEKLSKAGTMLSDFGAKVMIGSKKVGNVARTVTRSFSSNTYLDEVAAKKARTWLIIIVSAIALISIVALVLWHNSKKTEAQALEAAAPYRSQLSSIVASAATDPIPARETAGVLIETIKSAQSKADASGEKRTAKELAEVLVEAQSAYQEISGKEEVSELPVFYDLRLVTSDFIALLATSAGDNALFIDTEKKQTIGLNLQTKAVFESDLSSLAPIKSLAPFQDTQTVLLADGLYSLDLVDGAQAVKLKEEGDSNRDATLIASFGSYVYVFNPDKRNIYRYIKQEDGYSDPVGWLVDPLGVPFESVVSWAIDGDIWMGTQGGQILRFASGKSQDFVVTGLSDSFTSALYVVTREDLNNIYVLEPARSRLVVLSKEGQFIREIKNSSLGAATQALISADGSTAYVVSGSTVFSVEL